MERAITKKQLKKIVKIFNREFSKPFLENGIVKAKYYKEENIINIQIGARDIDIDNRLKVVGSGTCLF